MFGGGTVFVAYPDTEPRTLITVLDVRPGDMLAIGAKASEYNGGSSVTINVPNPSAGVVEVFSPCFGKISTTSMSVMTNRNPACATSYGIGLVRVASDGMKFATISDIPASAPSVMFNEGHFHVPVAKMLKWTNQGAIEKAAFDLISIVDDQRLATRRTPPQILPGATQIEGGTVNDYELAVTLDPTDPGLMAQHLRVRQLYSQSWDIDLADANLAPWITAPVVSSTAIEWNENAGSSRQLIVADVEGQHMGKQYIWRWIAPATTLGSLALPELPPQLAEFRITSGNALAVKVRLIRLIPDTIGYDDVRVRADLAVPRVPTDDAPESDFTAVPGLTATVVSGL